MLRSSEDGFWMSRVGGSWFSAISLNLRPIFALQAVIFTPEALKEALETSLAGVCVWGGGMCVWGCARVRLCIRCVPYSCVCVCTC